MKIVLAFLTILNSFSLIAGLKHDKIGEALIKAQFQQIKDQFFYSLTEDTEMKEKTEAMNQSSPLKTYGPYQLTLKGLKPGTRFGLYQFNLLGLDNPPFIGSGYIDQEREAWIKKKEGKIKLSNDFQFVSDTLPGEPVYSMVVLGDKKTYLAACLVPNPLEVYGKNGRHVTMQLFTPKDARYMAYGENFEPEEEITLWIHSKAGLSKKHLKASKEGTFTFMIEGDRSQGQLEQESIQIFSAEQADPMTICYDWKFLYAGKGK